MWSRFDELKMKCNSEHRNLYCVGGFYLNKMLKVEFIILSEMFWYLN